MRKMLIVGATILSVAGLASAGVAVNAATLSLARASTIGQAPGLLVPAPTPSAADDERGERTSGVSDDPTPAPTSTPTPSLSPETGDDGPPQHPDLDDAARDGDDDLPRHSGLDDGPEHDADDDDLPQHSGLDDGPEHDVGDDNPGESHSDSNDDSEDDDEGDGSDD